MGILREHMFPYFYIPTLYIIKVLGDYIVKKLTKKFENNY